MLSLLKRNAKKASEEKNPLKKVLKKWHRKKLGLWLGNFCLLCYRTCFASFYPIFTCVDPYSEYGSGSTKFLITDPIWIWIHNTGSTFVTSACVRGGGGGGVEGWMDGWMDEWMYGCRPLKMAIRPFFDCLWLFMMLQARSWDKLKKAVIAIQTAQAINTSLGRRKYCTAAYRY